MNYKKPTLVWFDFRIINESPTFPPDLRLSQSKVVLLSSLENSKDQDREC